MPRHVSTAALHAFLDDLHRRETQAASHDELLAARRIDADNPPPEPAPIFTLNGHTLCTPGNLAQLQSKAKSGKTAVVGAMVAAALSQEFGNDTFGFGSDPAREGAIIIFDSEQSRWKAHAVVRTALRRAQLATHPLRLRGYSLVGLSRGLRRRLLERELANAGRDFGGVHSVFLDGVAHLCHNLNDEDEVVGLVEELHALSGAYSTVILGVLHENPGKESSKSRGHLGSEMQRMSEANIIVSKDVDGVSEIYGDACRECDIQKGKGPKFKYDVLEQMHVSCEVAARDGESAKRDRMIDVVNEAFDGVAVLKYSELHAAIMRTRNVKSTAADNNISKLLNERLIIKNGQGHYLKSV